MRIRIKAGDKVIHCELEENMMARKLYSSLPMTFMMQNLYQREMCVRLGFTSLDSSKIRNQGYEPGDLVFYPYGGALVLLYAQDHEVYPHETLGHIKEDVSFFKDQTDMLMTFEKDEESLP